ncbi:hypothetical protein EDI_298730 [Entamoeba dispar SAW760]|uniref:Uncharacterized protein n=1 Tax=Entamoeba dispar (strain ATCC PRA-260 / SAW760) TaxID=370354 RepID=B0EQM2_ENTDS|nr:uncharacterized protein EDI_298730 [Entamoeba dispar SAW760]EDR23174.1 hypothetical protein EDI_298730 [Entamoeba dispar SAW760]|eukprot:EDR23174.1 hypothetical protein EDI_298730 [Entamoeba dispar SAW760]
MTIHRKMLNQFILTNKYSYIEFTKERIKEIAESLKHDNNQDLLDKLKIEISELKNKLKKLCGDAVTELGKVIVQKVEDVSDVAVSILIFIH